MNAPLRHAPTVDEVLADLEGESAIPSEVLPKRSYRRRRRGQRESDLALHNHQTERWIVSYADFITLLFAFFVVMYAMSSVNEGRFRVVSGALSSAFSPGDAQPVGGHAEQSPEPIAAARVASPVVASAVPPVPPPVDDVKLPVDPPPESALDAADRAELARTAERVQRMEKMAATMDERLQSLVRDGRVRVTRGARGIAIEINAAVLFDPARAELKPASFEALRSLAQVLAGFVEPLQIEGHSDDVPITTREFRSNWELSAARAASVGRFLIEQGVAPGRIGIAGYAEYRPVVDNASPEARARNRRVTLLVLSADDARAQGASGGKEPAAATPVSNEKVTPPLP